MRRGAVPFLTKGNGLKKPILGDKQASKELSTKPVDNFVERIGIIRERPEKEKSL